LHSENALIYIQPVSANTEKIGCLSVLEATQNSRFVLYILIDLILKTKQYDRHLIVYSAQCTVYSVYSVVYSVQCSLI